MKLAIFVDLDNIKNEISLSRFYAEIVNFGTVKFNYGYYSNLLDKKITELLHLYGINLVAQESFSDKKSCTDIKITIDAIEMLLTNHEVDAYVIVSNDSDFIKLSERIRRNGKQTIIATDKESFNRDYYKYFDKYIDLFDLKQQSPLKENPRSKTSELSILEGEKNENISGNDNNSMKTDYVYETDNNNDVEFDDKDEKINSLLKQIKRIMLNLNNDNNLARLTEVIQSISNENGKKFSPKDYGYKNGRVLEFIKTRLVRFIETRKIVNTDWIKVKTKEVLK